MNAIQKKLKKMGACKEGVEEAGRYRTAEEAWHGWQNGEDLLWLLVTLRMPRKRLKAVMDAVARQAQEWAGAAARKRWAADREACYAAEAAKVACAAQAAARAAWDACYAAAAAARAARAAEFGGVMTQEEAQAVLAGLVRQEVPWEEVRELWKGAC